MMHPDYEGKGVRVFTIGFTKKTAEQFFGLLRDSGAKRVIDIRLNNTSQIAGFTKKKDLQWFLGELCNIEYLHMPLLSPTQEMIDHFRGKLMSWEEFRRQFLVLLEERSVHNKITPELLGESCLLCSEEHAEDCHRSFVLEYLAEHWGVIESINLGE